MTAREAASDVLSRPVRRVVRRVRRLLGRSHPDPANQQLRDEIRLAGGRVPPRRLPRLWVGWSNRALQTRADADRAAATLRRAGLIPHTDAPKSWDAIVALGTILDRVPRSGRVLEMGATRYSPLLTWLFQHGYRKLVGIDLVYRRRLRRGSITYLPMDLTATTFEDASFDAVACLSVIEHGVDVDRFLAESARLLKPGGVLIVSTDYWPEPIDTGDREAYGQPVRVFDEASIADLLERARRRGLIPTGDVDLSARDRVVRWERMDLDYTFLVLVFERIAAAA